MRPPTPTTKRAHTTWTQARNSYAKPGTYKATDSQTRDARVGTKTPEAPAPAPSPGPSLCLLEALSLWQGSPSRRTPGIWRPLLTPWVQEKLRGPIPVLLVQRRPLAKRGGQAGVAGSRSIQGRARTHLEACAAAASGRTPRRPGRGPSGRRFSLCGAARPLAPARPWASPPPARRPVAAPPAAQRFRECRQSVCFSWRAPRPRPACGARAEPGRHPRERLKSAHAAPAHSSRPRSQLPASGIPAPFPERLSNLSRWPHSQEHLEVAGECE